MRSRPVLIADLGKSRCRVAVHGADRELAFDGVGSPGLAAAGGVDAAAAAILPLVAEADAALGDRSYGSVSVGAAGAWAAPEAASALARLLVARLQVPVAVTSDVVSAHAGALGGGEGVLLIAGTGAAALGIDSAGIRLVDGWGPEVGDLGSGSWLGREALRAVLGASVGLTESTVLSDTVAAAIGPIEQVQQWLSQDDRLARRLAGLAPLVLGAAAEQDRVAGRVAAEAAALLVASAVVSSRETRRVALHGGLTEHEWFRSLLEDALRASDREPVAPAGDALDGARLIADRVDLPHERFVHRAQ